MVDLHPNKVDGSPENLIKAMDFDICFKTGTHSKLENGCITVFIRINHLRTLVHLFKYNNLCNT